MKNVIILSFSLMTCIALSIFSEPTNEQLTDEYYRYLSKTFGLNDRNKIVVSIETKQEYIDKYKNDYLFKKFPEKLKAHIETTWSSGCDEFLDTVIYYKDSTRSLNNAIRILFEGDSIYYYLQNQTNGMPDSLWISKSFMQTTYSFYKNGNLGGELKTFYPSGNKKCHYIYKNGNIVGRSTCWYENGKPWSVEYYNNKGKLLKDTCYLPSGEITECEHGD